MFVLRRPDIPIHGHEKKSRRHFRLPRGGGPFEINDNNRKIKSRTVVDMLFAFQFIFLYSIFSIF